ncbi:MAG: hypothetical protein ACLTDR_05890 [Adlercreutzia equolifaciens]
MPTAQVARTAVTARSEARAPAKAQASAEAPAAARIAYAASCGMAACFCGAVLRAPSRRPSSSSLPLRPPGLAACALHAAGVLRGLGLASIIGIGDVIPTAAACAVVARCRANVS